MRMFEEELSSYIILWPQNIIKFLEKEYPTYILNSKFMFINSSIDIPSHLIPIQGHCWYQSLQVMAQIRTQLGQKVFHSMSIMCSDQDSIDLYGYLLEVIISQSP